MECLHLDRGLECRPRLDPFQVGLQVGHLVASFYQFFQTVHERHIAHLDNIIFKAFQFFNQVLLADFLQGRL